jgi:RNA polymerase sigma-70 factor (ECF subfamily)
MLLRQDIHESTTERDETGIILAICAGETRLFHDLIQPYERTVYRMAFSVLRNEADAEDAAQAACIKVFAKLDDFRMESSFNTWLISIVLNEARGLLRKRKRISIESLDRSMADFSTWSRDIADGRTLPIRQLLQQEIQILVHEAISSLPAMYGDVFRLRELEGRSIYESAEMLGVSESVIKIRLHRARQKLKRYLRIVYPSNFPVEKLG